MRIMCVVRATHAEQRTSTVTLILYSDGSNERVATSAPLQAFLSTKRSNNESALPFVIVKLHGPVVERWPLQLNAVRLTSGFRTEWAFVTATRVRKTAMLHGWTELEQFFFSKQTLVIEKKIQHSFE